MKKLLLSLGLVSCGSSIKDVPAYKAELSLYDTWAYQQAKIIRKFIARGCPCILGQNSFESDKCSLAADYVLTVEARHEWHMQMTYYNAGLSDSRPSATPPVIPPLTCPLPEETP